MTKKVRQRQIKYPDDYNPILEYWNSFRQNGGNEVVGDKIYRTYKKIVRDLELKVTSYYFSPRRSNHAIEFIENYCKHSRGAMGGKPFILELWQKAMVATIFGFIDTEGLRKYQRAVLIVGKKNGKSALGSAIMLYLQIGDGEPGPEIYSVATKKDQAKIVWNESKRMVKKSPALRKRIKTLTHILDSEDYNDGFFKALASDVDSLDGLNVHGANMDEWHQWRNGRPLYDIIADGITARLQPLILMTSTAGTIREDIYDEIYEESEMTIDGYDQTDGYRDERSIFFVYELDKKSEWTDPDCWKKANPGLGTIKNAKTLAEKVDKAKQNSRLVKNLVCKEFNIRETSTESWLSFEELNNPVEFDVKSLKPRYGIGGIDLSATTDLTCATVIFMIPDDENIYVLQMYFMPEDLFEERIKEDKVPYNKWKEQGLLRLCQGNKVHYRDCTEWFLEVQNDLDIYLYQWGYDAWSSTYYVKDMQQEFGEKTGIPIRQGKRTLSSPMKSLGADLKKKRINYNNHPILKWCISNTKIDVDQKNGTIQPIKGANSRKRIDGLASLLDAYVVYEEVMDDYRNVI